MTTALWIIFAGWALNVLLAVPWYRIESRVAKAAGDEDGVAAVYLGTVALSLVPWLYFILHFPVLLVAIWYVARGRSRVK